MMGEGLEARLRKDAAMNLELPEVTHLKNSGRLELEAAEEIAMMCEKVRVLEAMEGVWDAQMRSAVVSIGACAKLEEELTLTKAALYGALKAVRVKQEQAAVAAMLDVRKMVRAWHANTVNEGLRKDSEGILANIDSMINAVLQPNKSISCRS